MIIPNQPVPLLSIIVYYKYYCRLWHELVFGLSDYEAIVLKVFVQKHILASGTFVNDRVANALRSSPGVNTARDRFYKLNKSHYDYTFGLSGLKNAGLNPIEQFVGSYSVDITVQGDVLQYTISNTTSFSSFDYHITPSSWNWSSGPMGNFDQTYIFTEPLKKWLHEK